MSAVRLLDHYERIAEAPDATAHLRRLILDLAVRGKLAAQDLNEAPASELFNHIAAERLRLIKPGSIRSPTPAPALEELPFEIPPNWRWTQIAELGEVAPRNQAPDDLRASFVPMSLIAAEYGVPNEHQVRAWGGIKKGYTHFAEGDVGLAKITPCFENCKSTVFRNLTGGLGSGTTELHVVRPILVDPDYILIFLKSPYFIEAGIPRMTGTAGQKRVPLEYFAHSPFPLPPLAEQRRIVAKVNELMALCDRLEATRKHREDTRGQLTSAALVRLLNLEADPTEFASHLGFVLEALQQLTARPSQLEDMRKTIIGLGIVGRLTGYQPGDVGSSVDLETIKKRKAQLALRKPKAIRVIEETEHWSTLPEGWAWARWEDITDWITYGFTRPMPHVSDGIPIVTGKNVNGGRVIFESADRTTAEAHAKLSEKDRPKKGDILLTKDGSIGRSAIVETQDEFCINQSVAVLWLRSCHLNTRFLQLVIESPQTQSALLEKTEGVAIKHISIVDFGSMLLPVPPLAEQARIVNRVEQLVALCDLLRQQLSSGDAIRVRLLKALIHEALRRAY
jgi:type I restriction enzyme, S subunit